MKRGPTNPKLLACNGVGEIRTHGPVARSAVFKTAAFNHSATTPVNHRRKARQEGFFAPLSSSRTRSSNTSGVNGF